MNHQKPVISVNNLSRTYLVNNRESGFAPAIKSLWNRQYEEIKAVNNISFEISEGATIGFLGPNGAGKTTTLKMLSGLLYSTSGTVEVLGYVPSQRKSSFLRQIALVMGRRNQLVWDIPAADSFTLNQAIYEIPENEFQQTKNELIDLLDIEVIVKKPVRTLSLGERMKCELVGALLHRPKVLLLDEPTIGLDIMTQRKIRTFLKHYNEAHQATILLTSHYMADVEALCKDVIIINEGELVYQGHLTELAQRYAPYSLIKLKLDPEKPLPNDLTFLGEIIEHDEDEISIKVPVPEVASRMASMFNHLAILDVKIHDTSLEDIIEQAFSSALAS